MNWKIFKQHEVFLGGLFLLFIVLDIPVPAVLGTAIHSLAGNMVVLALAVYVFAYVHPFVGIVGLYAAYELLKRSIPVFTHIPNFAPEERLRDVKKVAPVPIPTTLEEEIVKQRVSKTNSSSHTSGASYKPILEDSGQSSFI